MLEALEPIKQACADRLSLTRCASDISRSDLHEVRGAFRTNLQVKNAQDQPPLHEEELWYVLSYVSTESSRHTYRYVYMGSNFNSGLQLNLI